MKILLVDLSSLFWMNWHATKDEEVGNAFDNTIAKIHKYSHDYDSVGICLDSPPYKRKEIYPEYKVQRDRPSEVAIGQLKRVVRRLKLDGFPLFSVDGYEADDVIASICPLHGYISQDDTIDILTGDKDLTQCITEQICTISTRDGVVYDPPAVFEKFGVNPDKMCDFLALTGDKSDNVPGVPGIGPKTAARLINQFGGLTEIMESVQAGSDNPALKKIANQPTQILLAQQLIKLNDCLDIDVSPLFADRKAQAVADEPEVEVIEETETPAGVQTTEIIPRPTVEFSKQLEPVSADGAWRIARVLFESRLYSHFQSREAIMAVLMRGRALGLDATTSLDAFHVIKGRPTMSADLIVGLVMRSKKCRFFKMIESSDKVATYKTHRTDDPDPDPTTHSFTMEQARQMGLSSKDNWMKQPATMLRHRCATALARMVYPDVVGGLYDPEEVE